MTRIIEFWGKKVRESPVTEGSGRPVRGAHAKTLGMVRAEVVRTGNAPAPYPQGICAKPGCHDALIRFSSTSNHLGPDAALGPVLSFAIKIFDVGGTKLVEDEPDSATFDLVLKNSPTFIDNRRLATRPMVTTESGNLVARYVLAVMSELGGARCPSESFVGSHLPIANGARVCRAPPLPSWSLRLYAHRGIFGRCRDT